MGSLEVARGQTPVVLNHDALAGPGKHYLLDGERSGDQVDPHLLVDLDTGAAADGARLAAVDGELNGVTDLAGVRPDGHLRQVKDITIIVELGEAVGAGRTVAPVGA